MIADSITVGALIGAVDVELLLLVGSREKTRSMVRSIAEWRGERWPGTAWATFWVADGEAKRIVDLGHGSRAYNFAWSRDIEWVMAWEFDAGVALMDAMWLPAHELERAITLLMSRVRAGPKIGRDWKPLMVVTSMPVGEEDPRAAEGFLAQWFIDGHESGVPFEGERGIRMAWLDVGR